MQTLSKGYKLPETGDLGNEWFPAMEDNIQQLNDHDHDGVDGIRISVLTTVVSGASWAAYGGPVGMYRQTINIPSGATFETRHIQVRRTASPYEAIQLDVEKASSTTFYIYSNDNALGVTVLFV